ncbi:histidine phosphatase family protein [Mycolicibacterium thermoresistibile]
MSGRLVLVRHGQSQANVERRLDTAPPGAELTDLGRQQARAFARQLRRPPGLLVHSVAVRAEQTAGEAGSHLGQQADVFEGIHEVQAGELENRNDDEAITEFETVYQQWHQGNLKVNMPGGENGVEVLDRYVSVITQLRLHYLDNDAWTDDIVVVSHGAAIRLVAATLAGVDSTFALDRHLGNTESVVLAPITDGRWSCLQWGKESPPFYPEPDVQPVEDALHSVDPMG